MKMTNNDAHFVFDSNHIHKISSRLYGFYTTEKGMFTHTCPDSDCLDGTGVWVVVKRLEDHIEIQQDHIGSFGLFLFRNKDYWAISNSFNHLVDYLKYEQSLHINDAYALAYLTQQLCISAYGKTMIEEIQWLDRRAKVRIDLKDGSLAVEYKSFNERKVPVDSKEGIRLLDRWHDKWATFIHQAHTYWPSKMEVDVSGGMDTRMVLAPVLSSQVNLEHIQFNSNVNREEDYRIAQQIANTFGFTLNKKVETDGKISQYPVIRFMDRALQTLFFEKALYTPNIEKTVAPLLAFSGSSGGMVRNYHGNKNCSEYTQRVLRRIPKSLSKDKTIRNQIEVLLKASYQDILSMLEQVENRTKKEGLSEFEFYLETRNRSHFGISNARGILSQYYSQSILMDPLLMRLDTPKDHLELIPTLIYTRYHSDLATIPIEGNRTLNQETINYANTLNQRFKKSELKLEEKEETIHFSYMNPTDQELSYMEKANQPQPIQELLLQAYQSSLVQKLFYQHFGHRAKVWSQGIKGTRHANANKYAVVAIAKVLYDIQKGKEAPSDFAAFLEECKKKETKKGQWESILRKILVKSSYE